jgi:hypothetical protein
MKLPKNNSQFLLKRPKDVNIIAAAAPFHQHDILNSLIFLRLKNAKVLIIAEAYSF